VSFSLSLTPSTFNSNRHIDVVNTVCRISLKVFQLFVIYTHFSLVGGDGILSLLSQLLISISISINHLLNRGKEKPIHIKSSLGGRAGSGRIDNTNPLTATETLVPFSWDGGGDDDLKDPVLNLLYEGGRVGNSKLHLDKSLHRLSHRRILGAFVGAGGTEFKSIFVFIEVIATRAHRRRVSTSGAGAPRVFLGLRTGDGRHFGLVLGGVVCFCLAFGWLIPYVE
jgi:hypothetical protein